MSETHKDSTTPADIELAAGGLVYSNKDGDLRLAIVHRPKYNDWTLPKGRLKPQETVEAAALREAMEETGHKATLTNLAGAYCYLKGGHLKVVVIWHMTCQEEEYPQKAGRDEVDRVRWLVPDRAIGHLTHATEREFVARHCEPMCPVPAGRSLLPNPKLDRLRAALESGRERLRATMSRQAPDAWTWWAPAACRLIEAARAAVKRGDLDAGWGAIHGAERLRVFGMDDTELLTRAASLKAETQTKLKGWRLRATKSLFAPLKLADWLKAKPPLEEADRVLLRQAVAEALEILNEHSDNLYHRLHLVGRQLIFLVAACGFIVVAALWGASFFAPADSDLGWNCLAAVALAGALGGVVSAMYQLSRVGEVKIPDALLHGLITSGRPLVGAASALFVYVVMQSGLIGLIDAASVSLEAGLVLGFVAGFSEQFVLSTVAKVAGRDKGDSRANDSKHESEGLESVGQLDLGSQENTKPKAPSPPEAPAPPAAEPPVDPDHP